MGYLIQSDHIISEQTRILSDIHESQMTHFLQGQGSPVITTWFSVDQITSTVTPGLETVDDLMGDDSGLFYHLINGIPVLGLSKDFNPELSQGEGGVLSYDLDLEITTLPKTITPQPFEYVYYRFGKSNERSVLFRVVDVKKSSIKSNFYHKVELHAVDIDDMNGMYAKLLKHVTKRFKILEDRIGTQDGCIVEDEVYDQIKILDKIYHAILNNYVDYFYDSRYNAVLHRNIGIDHPLYDPHLTRFLITSGIMEKHKPTISLMEIDDIPGKTRAEYNLTMYNAVENRNIDMLRNDLIIVPTTFQNTVITPFDYYGEELVFKASIEKGNIGSKNSYMSYPIIKVLKEQEESILLGLKERMIYNYFTKSDPVDYISMTDLEELKHFGIDYDEYNIHIIPIVLFIIDRYQEALGISRTAFK